MFFAQTFNAEFSDLFKDTEEYEKTVDWDAVSVRLRTYINENEIGFHDVAAVVGLDLGAMDYMEKYKKLPKLKTVITVSAFLGISAAWVLTGKGEKPITFRANEGNGAVHANNFRDSSDSTFLQGNTAGSIMINTAQQMSEQKKELLRIFGRLSIREQTKLLHLAYEIEDSANKH